MKRGPNDGRWQLRLDFGGGAPSAAELPLAKVPQEGGINYVRAFTDDPAVPLIGSRRATLKSSPVAITSVTTHPGTLRDDAAPVPRVATVAVRRRLSARLPVPDPLPKAVAAGHFGHHEDGRPVHPSSQEVREITESHADALAGHLTDRQYGPFELGITKYAESFGAEAAERLRSYAHRLARHALHTGRER